MRDKRRSPRVPTRNPVHVTVVPIPAGQGAARSFLCSTADISEGGVRLRSTDELFVDQDVELRVASTEPPASFKLMGNVSWRTAGSDDIAFFIGINVQTTADKELTRWREFVKTKTPTRYRSGDPRADVRERGTMW